MGSDNILCLPNSSQTKRDTMRPQPRFTRCPNGGSESVSFPNCMGCLEGAEIMQAPSSGVDDTFGACLTRVYTQMLWPRSEAGGLRGALRVPASAWEQYGGGGGEVQPGAR